jgi:hypothetical protein
MPPIVRYLLVGDCGYDREQDYAVLAAHLDDHWLILDNRRSELLADSKITYRIFRTFRIAGFL